MGATEDEASFDSSILNHWLSKASAFIGFIFIPYMLSYWYQKAYWNFIGAPWVLTQQDQFKLLLGSERVLTHILAVILGLLIPFLHIKKIPIKWIVVTYLGCAILTALMRSYFPIPFVTDFIGAVPLALTMSVAFEMVYSALHELKSVDAKCEKWKADFLLKHANKSDDEEFKQMFTEAMKPMYKSLLMVSVKRSIKFALGSLFLVCIFIYYLVAAGACQDAYMDANPRNKRLVCFRTKEDKKYYMIASLENGVLAYVDVGANKLSAPVFLPYNEAPFYFDFGEGFLSVHRKLLGLSVTTNGNSTSQ